MKMLVIYGDFTGSLPTTGAFFLRDEDGIRVLAADEALPVLCGAHDEIDYLYFDEDELDENTAAELNRLWNHNLDPNYLNVFDNIWNELKEVA